MVSLLSFAQHFAELSSRSFGLFVASMIVFNSILLGLDVKRNKSYLEAQVGSQPGVTVELPCSNYVGGVVQRRSDVQHTAALLKASFVQQLIKANRTDSI